MKPMNRMEAFLMGDKTLAPETIQEAVAQYVGSKLGGTKEQILLFENVTYKKNESRKSFDDLGVSEIINNLPGVTGSHDLLKAYRLILYIQCNSNFSKLPMEYPLEHRADSSNCYRVLFCKNESLNMCAFEFNETFGETYVRGLSDEDSCIVTCYLEKL